MSVNEARFTINGTPATDPTTGDPQYVAIHSQTLDCTLEQSPSSASLASYEVFDPNDSTSPLASYQATNLTWVASGLPRQNLTNPNGTAQIIMPAKGIHSYLIRCTVTLPDRTDIFERLVAIEDTLFTPAIRKTIPAEVEEFYTRGYSDEINKMVAGIGSSVGAFGSAGTSPKTYISDAGGGNIDITAGAGYIRTSNAHDATLVGLIWSAVSGTAIPADTIRYVGVEYNSGSPQAVVRTADNWNNHDDFRLGTVVNESGTLHILNNAQIVSDGMQHAYDRFYDTGPFKRADRAGGLIIGETGVRNITMSAGGLWDGLNEFTLGAIDTSGADTFDAYYRAPLPNWTKVAAQSQYDNANYDDGSGVLQAIGVNKYVTHWFYVEADGHIIMLYSWGQFNTLAQAEDATPPSSVPDRILAHGQLLGRVIYQQGDASATEVESAFAVEFGLTAVTSHLSLTDIGTNTHAQIDTHIASTANPHQVTLDQAYDGAGAGAGRTITVDQGAVLLNAVDVTTGVLEIVQTPTGGIGGAEIIVSIQAQGANWVVDSRVLQLITDDDDAVPLVINNGAADTVTFTRAGGLSLAENLSLGSGTPGKAIQWGGSLQQFGGFQNYADDGLRICVGDTNGNGNYNLLIIPGDHRTKNFDHNPKSTHPSAIIHSNLDPDTDNGESNTWTYAGLTCGTMETDRATFDFTVTSTSAFAGAAGANRNGGDVVLVGGTAAAGGVSGMVKIGAGSPSTITPAVGAQYITASLEIGNDLVIGGGVWENETDVSGAAYTVDSGGTNDHYLSVSRPSAGACAITIPSAAIVAGRVLIIKDQSLNCSVNNITVGTAGAELIEGAANLVMNVDGMCVQLRSDGTDLFVT